LTVALIDGDALVYRCGFAAEKTHYVLIKVSPEGAFNVTAVEDYRSGMKLRKEVGGELWSRKEIEPVENCLQMVNTSLENTLKVLNATQYRVYLSGRRNFRDAIYGDYKANRDGTARPKYFRDIRDHLLGQWQGIVCDGIEADDAVGIDACTLGNDSIIVAVDKDLDQIPGQHYNWTDGKLYNVSPREGLGFFYEQMLSGDDTDNIPGIDGVGPVKARKALVDCKTPKACATQVWSMYHAARDQFGFADDAQQRAFLDRNAHLLWIQRKKDDKHPFWKHYEG
jgi:5'-3' exonuclease